MLKTAMLVSAMAISTPALAQDTVPAGRTPQTTQAVPVQTPAPVTDPATTVAPGAPIPGAPATAPAEQVAAPAPATAPETATPVTGATQIAQVVDTEFPTYDKNADTNLDKTEFSAWMVALKTASDPATKASDPATVKWVDGAFASADADKSAAISKDELTKYLSQGAE